ncbi:MAG: Asp-tRNA(Asn)/Glu-tRNA(Gln) amidotransferase subunit GatC [Niabella sp.]|nr:Asp-tRNA(Asn)/Glu-tRNA(Gln) amidotransferase subunit GatC [Niabella sp.]
MEVNEALIDKLAHLSKLTFSAEEKTEFMGDLQKMIGFVEKLNELDLRDVEPLMHMSDVTNVLRDDTIKGSVTRDEALLNAPETDGVFFKVPKVIKK